MTRAALLALADCVEKADGPDRMLDAEIAAAVAPGNCLAVVGKRPGYYMAQHTTNAQLMRRKAPFFTASLDVALTLVPEGWECALYWGVRNFAPEAQLERQDRHETFAEPTTGTGVTPALALTAAALRALAEGRSDE